jgi:predicted AlkP superfamily pyrophosphatase or phosphodiesterase
MRKILVVLVVGLTPKHLKDAPRLSKLKDSGHFRPLEPVLPAVTCTVQSSLLTGGTPQETGIVGNGWYFRELAEVKFWCQSNSLVSGEKLWESARIRDPNVSCAKMFWWYNMYSSANWSVTPRPAYPADGRKIPDIYSEPPELRLGLNKSLGRFPLFNFWGPTADIVSTRWIVEATCEVIKEKNPGIALAYLPHLDYNLQRLGPSDPRMKKDIEEVDIEAARLVEFGQEHGYDVVVVSEYGITDVSRPIHINRILRQAGLIRTQKILEQWELLDCGACKAFAVADHQLAHVYVNDPGLIPKVKELLTKQEGVERVYTGEERQHIGLNHSRAGDLIVIAQRDAWFTYYYWNDDALAPDFARCVDIHRKPGYDPVELFVDPTITFPKLRVASRLARKILGFRYYMDLIGLDANLVKGSHGRKPDTEEEGPLVLASWKNDEDAGKTIKATDFKEFILQRLFEAQ